MWRFFVFLVLLIYKPNVGHAHGYAFEGIDLSDISTYAAKNLPDSLPLIRHLHNRRDLYWSDLAVNAHELLNTELSGQPRMQDQDRIYPLISTLRDSENRVFFRRFEVRMSLGASGFEVREVRFQDEIPLGSTEFSAHVGLIERKVVLRDTRHGITKIYPIGVGGVDTVSAPGYTRLLTPLMKAASLRKKYVIPKRTHPSYYKGKPFLRISKANGGPTAFGFHIEVNDHFVRGFDSHGCMRLREKDLKEFFSLVYYGAFDALPVDISFYVPNTSEHPLPLNDQYYMRVRNYGSASQPRSRRGKDGLIIMERVNGPAPIREIIGGRSFIVH